MKESLLSILSRLESEVKSLKNEVATVKAIANTKPKEVKTIIERQITAQTITVDDVIKGLGAIESKKKKVQAITEKDVIDIIKAQPKPKATPHLTEVDVVRIIHEQPKTRSITEKDVISIINKQPVKRIPTSLTEKDVINIINNIPVKKVKVINEADVIGIIEAQPKPKVLAQINKSDVEKIAKELITITYINNLYGKN